MPVLGGLGIVMVVSLGLAVGMLVGSCIELCNSEDDEDS